MMQRGRFVALILSAALLSVAYRIYFTDDEVPIHSWYDGQDITEGDDPIPFNAQSGSHLISPQRDEYGALPSEVYRDYTAAAARDYFDLSLLTASSRAMFLEGKPSQEQLRNTAAAFKACGDAEEGADGDYAVLLYPPAERLCDPVLFKREQGLWKIDLAAMREEIGHNHANQWHFSRATPPLDYAFAFRDWLFDANGYPQE
jgi:hypothetical protein